MSFEGLQERLAALQETTLQLRDLIDRLANWKVGPGTEAEDGAELSGEIAQILREGQEDLKVLGEEVEFVKVESHELKRLKEGVETLGKELTRCRISFRKARLSAKRALAVADRLDHEHLIASYSPHTSTPTSPVLPPTRTARQAHHHAQQAQSSSSLSASDQANVGASGSVTTALRRTHDLIAAELQRSAYAHEMLTESSAALKSLNESYSTLDGMLASSRDLLGTLLRSQKSDTWYLQTALYMLLVTGAWLVFRRLLYGPLWWLVWLPLRMMFGVGTSVGSAVMMKGSGEAAEVKVGLDRGSVPVERLQTNVPTAQVGQQEAVDQGDPESMVYKVGKIVDAVREADELGNIPGDDSTDEEAAKNTKKRVWEEPEVVQEEQQQPRDEL